MQGSRTQTSNGYVAIGCKVCPMTGACALIAERIGEVAERRSRSRGLNTGREHRSFDGIVEHLKRHGYRFPRIENHKKCWLHDKAGVLNFYQGKLESAAQMLARGGEVTSAKPRKSRRA